MVDIIAYGKKELSNCGMNFISVPVLSIPFLDKTYYAKTLWFRNKEELKSKLSTQVPLIVFDQTGKYLEDSIRGFSAKVPNGWDSPTAIFVRIITGIDSLTWGHILNNIFEPEQINFTFKIDFDNYKDALVEQYIAKQNKVIELQKIYDIREKDEYIASSISKKISFRPR